MKKEVIMQLFFPIMMQTIIIQYVLLILSEKFEDGESYRCRSDYFSEGCEK